ncbi:alpha-L-rhamnosidase-related protein [Paenibacillus arenilitoris]|uniref:Alpha-L-rhamnosidase N-terminal domain-containing protein n=1 Tax=Paenibacillus arenilitoris TaxID=2772299 RepID=A0A927H4B7_9BACL|nr:alpha-L-rhamnosidase N-terminal domain-containing protein [Paenibacillus arenilitoris]MBD2867212.1 alpha-L-rhamnosidase N-terminal domain-containing protein [Paenibacillus arenilitoris]
MERQWQASWIWAEHGEPDHNIYVEARKAFELDDAKRQAALLHVSANQHYKLYVNGTELGRGPSPGDNDWQYYDSYDVSAALRPGRNAIAILAFNFGGQEIVTQQMQGPGGFIAELETVAEDGTSRIAEATDRSWKARRSERWVRQVSRQHQWNGFRELYFAEQEDGWELADYDDSDWPGALVAAAACDPAGPWPRLLPREIPRLREEWITPAAVVGAEPMLGRILFPEALAGGGGEPKEGATVLDAAVPGSIPAVTYDFAKERVGYTELEVVAPEGGVLQLHYGESLELALYDTFFLKKGRNRLSPFGRRAFRFLKLTAQAAPAPVTVERLGVRSVHYPFPASGTFRCEDPLLERIWDTGRYTTVVNSQEHLEDCPLREGALWVVDAIVMGKVIYQTFGDARLLRKCLLQGARIQNADGSIPGTGPERNDFMLPDFCAHWLFGVRDYWSYTNDEPFLREAWPVIRRLTDWFEAQEDEDGLFAGADRNGWWCFIDWADYLDKRDRVTAVSCFYYKLLRTVAAMSAAAGDEPFGMRCAAKAGRLREAIRTQLWLPELGAFVDCKTDGGLSDSVTAQTNFTAIWTGVMTDEEAERFLAESYFQDRCPPIKGAFFYHIVLETLYRYGYAEQALDAMRAYWGEMLARGATTWWETFDPSTPRCTVPSPYQGNTPTYLVDYIPVSFCHGWGAAPTYLLTQRLLGVDASRIGSGAVELNPYASGRLAWAEGEVPTPYGTIRARWERQDGGAVAYEAELPQGLRWTSSFLTQIVEGESEGKRTVRGIVTADTVSGYSKPSPAII